MPSAALSKPPAQGACPENTFRRQSILSKVPTPCHPPALFPLSTVLCPLPMKIISGGQTGVDRAALDAAIDLNIPHGGWCPRGRLAEDGPIPPRYQLRETESPQYHVRTEQNVLDGDATLILCHGSPSGGTGLTLRLARRHGKPHLLVDLDAPITPEEAADWLAANGIKTLNVAGPRESQSPGIAAEATAFLRAMLVRSIGPQSCTERRGGRLVTGFF